jgi:hypothetical protein
MHLLRGTCRFTITLPRSYINVDDFRNRHAVVGSRHGRSYAQVKDVAWGHCSVMP